MTANTVETAFYLDDSKRSYIGGELEHFSVYVFPHWSSLTQALRTGQPQSGKHAVGHTPREATRRKDDLQPAARARSADHVPRTCRCRSFDNG
jgi:hypothetical protein